MKGTDLPSPFTPRRSLGKVTISAVSIVMNSTSIRTFARILLSCFLSIVMVAKCIDLFSVAEKGSAMEVHIPFEGRKHSSWFIYNSTRHLFPDRYTVLSYGFVQSSFAFVRPNSSIIAQANMTLLGLLKLGEDIDNRWNQVVDKDNKFMENLLISNDTKTNLVEESVSVLHNSVNAALMYRAKHNDWLVKVRGSSAAIYRLLFVSASNETSLSIDFMGSLKWLKDAHLKKWYSDDPGVPFIELVGADPRFIETKSGNILAIAAFDHKNVPYIREHITEILTRKNATSNKMEMHAFDGIEILVDIPQDPSQGLKDNKNW